MAVKLSKITTVASLLIICAATPPQPLYNTKQAVSSQSFVRHDIPLSYKYSAVHMYTTEKTNYQNEVPKIQYAPLYLPEELRIKNDLNTKVYHESEYTSQNRDIRKDHLEPKEISGTVKTHGYISYIPGHNIELLQSVNRSPGLNTDYRSFPETTSEANSKSTEKINYHRAYAVFQLPQSEKSPSSRPQEAIVSRPPNYDLNKQYNHMVNHVHPVSTFNGNTFQIPQSVNTVLEQQLHRNQQRLQDIHELTKQIESQRVSNHPKLNTMLLNLARVYNAHSPQNNHVKYIDSNQNKGTNSQAKGSALKKITADHINRLSPIRVAGNPQRSLHGLE